MRISDWSSDVCSSDLLYDCTPERLLIGRGSDEAIDLMVRAFCRPGVDAVLVTPPVFGMFAVCARLQRAPLTEVPLRDGGAEFSIEPEAVAALAERHPARLVSLSSPRNPIRALVPADAALDLSLRLCGRTVASCDRVYYLVAN